jgi:hypothetical protein
MTAASCPSWCRTPGDHDDSEGVVHLSEELTVDLALEPQIEMMVGVEGEPMRRHRVPDWVALYLRQDEHQDEASIHLGRNQAAGVTMTLEEARALAGALLNAADLLVGGR